MKLISFLFLFFTLVCADSKDFTIAQKVHDFAEDVKRDIYSVLVMGIAKIGNISNTSSENLQVTYWLSTKEAPDYEQITSLDQINPEKPVILLAHGWTQNRTVEEMTVIRDAYHIRYDANIIGIDYGDYVVGTYFSSYEAIQTVIPIDLADFLCDLNESINLTTVHIVGFSLGAHLAGIAGSLTKVKCNSTIGRITALDPAGPFFQGAPESMRLDETDALFVDVIHTNQGQAGFEGRIGHVDFYPNCGFLQPGCVKIRFRTSVKNVYDLPMKSAMCSHSRSCHLFAESINNNNFHSTSCKGCGLHICLREIIGAHYTYMGESCTGPQKKTQYKVKTASEPPYGLGYEPIVLNEDLS